MSQETQTADDEATAERARVLDTYQNFALQVGLGTDNTMSASQYGFNPITRLRQMLEWIYRGSWIGGVAVDAVADDMTRGGIEIASTMPPDQIETLQSSLVNNNVWGGLNETIKWARLYGGAIGVILIDGQKPETPLRIETIGRNQFRGILPLDRWMVEPDLNNLVTEYGPDLGNPRFYRVVADAPALSGQTVHYSRVIRFEGIRLPHWQRRVENLWGISVLERLYDRMVAFDSATIGAAQLVHKSHLRVIAIEGLRDVVAQGGKPYEGLMRWMEVMRRYQTNEGITLLDSKDQYTANQVNVQSGISDALVQFGQQISGALQIPLVRLFGQSPAGLSASGESDLRTYYDGVVKMQKRDLHRPLTKVLHISARSKGFELPKGFDFSFNSLWLMSDQEKAQIADTDTRTVLAAEEAGVIGVATALRELRQSSRVTGRWTNITDEMIEEAEEAEPPLAERIAQTAGELDGMMGGGGDPMGGKQGGQPAALPGQPQQQSGQSPDPARVQEDMHQDLLRAIKAGRDAEPDLSAYYDWYTATIREPLDAQGIRHP